MEVDGAGLSAARRRARVLVVAGGESTRQRVASVLKVAGHASDLAATVSDALTLVRQTHLRYVAAVIELVLDDGGGADLARTLLGDDACCCSLVIASNLCRSDVVALHRAGINRMLPWPSTASRLSGRVKETVADTIRYRATIAGSNDAPLDRLSRLLRQSGATVREAEIASMIANGATDREVADALDRSVSAVRKRIRRLRSLIGAPSKATLVAVLREL
jgi:DNA-binding NarL/FixJ family response regulator